MRKSLLTAALGSTTLLLWQTAAFAGQAGGAPSRSAETVVITASPFAQDPLDVAASVQRLDHQELLSSGGFGIGDALRDVPGLTSSGFSAGANRPVIRGLSANRVRVTENGIGGHDTSDIGDDHAVPIDALSSLQVEVLRGPATLRYGSQAIGGVINAINNRIPIDLDQGSEVEGFTSVSSNGTERIGGGIADYRDGNWAFHADGLIRGADDYDNPQGRQVNSFAFGRGFALGGAYIGDSGSAGGLSFNQYIAHYASPFPPGSTDKGHVDLNTKNYNGAGRLNEPLPGIVRINGQFGYTDYFHNEVEDGTGVVAHFTNREAEGRIEALHRGFGPITTGAIGIQFDNRDFAVSGLEADYLHPTTTDSFAAYIFEEFALTPQFSIQGAARVEWTNVTGDTDALGVFDRKFTPLSYAAGAVYKPVQNTSFFLNLSRTTRNPNAVELYAQGPHDSSATFEFGNPFLGTEKAFSIEGGVKHESLTGDTASFTIYRTKFDGFIDGFLTGNTRDDDGTFHPDDTGEFRELFYLQRDATFWGVEGQIHWHLFNIGNGRGGIDLQADYVRATLAGGSNVPRIPPLRWGGGLFFESTSMEFTAGFLRTASQDELGPQETFTPGYTMLNASAIFHLYEGEQGDVDLALIGTNLTDEVATNHISFSKDFMRLPGRTFRLVLHYTR